VKVIKKHIVLILAIVALAGAVLITQTRPALNKQPRVTTAILAKEVNTTPPARITGEIESSKTDEEWKKELTPLQFNILREAGTEIPYTSDLLNEKRKGTYVTADCNEPVFRSEQKYDSGTGWPSFYAPINPDAVVVREDYTLGETRMEVLGAKCGGHLGHVFEDGPLPTGLRYCMNGAALKFIPDKEQ
jgi:peptide-methionine (R)-S-oxide reductase